MANDSAQETNLVKTKTLTTRIPGEGLEEGIQLFGGIPKPREILAQDDDNIRAKSSRFSDQLELIEALEWRSAGLHEVDYSLVLLPQAAWPTRLRRAGMQQEGEHTRLRAS